MLSHQSPLLMFLFSKLSCCQEGSNLYGNSLEDQVKYIEKKNDDDEEEEEECVEGALTGHSHMVSPPAVRDLIKQ